MKTSSHLCDQLISLLHAALQKCQDNYWPFVCGMKQTPKGLARIEKYVLELARQEGMSIGSALSQLESELQQNHPIDH